MRTGASGESRGFCTRVLPGAELRRIARLYEPGARAVAAESHVQRLRRWESGISMSRSSCGGRSMNSVILGRIIFRSSLCPEISFTLTRSSASTRSFFRPSINTGKPPMQVMHEGGVFTTRTVIRDQPRMDGIDGVEWRLAPDLAWREGNTCGIHSGLCEREVFFSWRSRRVSGERIISDLVELRPESISGGSGRGWRFFDLRGEPYVLPDFAERYAGSVLCLATTAEPDTTAFNAPEIVKRMKKHHHAGLIVCSDSAGRTRELVDQYSAEFAHRFLAALPPPDKPTS